MSEWVMFKVIQGRRPWCQSTAQMQFLISLIVTLDTFRTFFEKCRIKLKIAVFTCLTPPLRWNPLEFLDEPYLTKTRGMELLRGENCMIQLRPFLFDPPVPTDGL